MPHKGSPKFAIALRPAIVPATSLTMKHSGNRARLVLLAFGDFAFNLFWQSIMLFLLFYYTDAIGLPISIAATTYMVASVWDGIANFVAGVLVDRGHHKFRYGALIAAGAVPLAVTFMLAYLPPGASGTIGILWVFVAHLLFRTAYAALNVPYLAMSARISSDPGDRAFVAGLRMMFGTAAAVTVASCTIPLGHWLTGSSASQAFFASACLFAAAGALILLIVGVTYREEVVPDQPPPLSLRAALASIAHNRAFIVLNLAMMAMIVGLTVLNKAVLYYFKYLLHDPQAGQLALASMGLVSGIAIPLWMVIGRRVGLRTLWLISASFGILGLLLFAAFPLHGSRSVQGFLIGMQVMSVGLDFVFWAMLPNTIDYGAKATGVYVEGTIFGVAALLQRISIGIATAILGWSFASAGYVANVEQSSQTLTSMRLTVALVPLAFLVLSCVVMAFNPLGRRPIERGSAEELRV